MEEKSNSNFNWKEKESSSMPPPLPKIKSHPKSHKIIEKERRQKINDKIEELRQTVSTPHGSKNSATMNKSQILQCAIDNISVLREGIKKLHQLHKQLQEEHIFLRKEKEKIKTLVRETRRKNIGIESQIQDINSHRLNSGSESKEELNNGFSSETQNFLALNNSLNNYLSSIGLTSQSANGQISFSFPSTILPSPAYAPNFINSPISFNIPDPRLSINRGGFISNASTEDSFFFIPKQEEKNQNQSRQDKT